MPSNLGPSQKAILKLSVFCAFGVAGLALWNMHDARIREQNTLIKGQTLRRLTALTAPDIAKLRKQLGRDADLYFITDLHTADGREASVSGSFSSDTGKAASGRDIFIVCAGTKKAEFDPAGLINFATEVIGKNPDYKAERVSSAAVYVRRRGSSELQLANPGSDAYKKTLWSLTLDTPAGVETLKDLFIRQAKSVEAQAMQNLKAGAFQPVPGN